MNTLPKEQLRSLYKNVRSHIGSDYAAKAAESAAKAFLKNIPLNEVDVIAGYMPLTHEFNVTPILDKLAALRHVCALPVVNGLHQPLLFRQLQLGTSLVPNAYNIAEPDNASPLVTPTIIIIPLLVCDKTGTRLGYGKGYYDVTLNHLIEKGKQILKVGICYQVQLSETLLPCDPHDQKLDMVITEKSVHVIKL